MQISNRNMGKRGMKKISKRINGILGKRRKTQAKKKAANTPKGRKKLKEKVDSAMKELGFDIESKEEILILPYKRYKKHVFPGSEQRETGKIDVCYC
jgi:hypothetical protein